jgi:hypothetical protein
LGGRKRTPTPPQDKWKSKVPTLKWEFEILGQRVLRILIFSHAQPPKFCSKMNAWRFLSRGGVSIERCSCIIFESILILADSMPLFLNRSPSLLTEGVILKHSNLYFSFAKANKFLRKRRCCFFRNILCALYQLYYMQ